MAVVLGQRYGKLTVVKKMHYRYYAERYAKLRWKGQPCWLVVCDCGLQFPLPEGRILEPPYPEVQACQECQPHVVIPAVPVGRTRHAGHALVDELEAQGLSPIEAYFEYLRRTTPEPVPSPAQLRALRALLEPDLGIRVPPGTLRALEARKWVKDGQVTQAGKLRLDGAKDQI